MNLAGLSLPEELQKKIQQDIIDTKEESGEEWTTEKVILHILKEHYGVD